MRLKKIKVLNSTETWKSYETIRERLPHFAHLSIMTSRHYKLRAISPRIWSSWYLHIGSSGFYVSVSFGATATVFEAASFRRFRRNLIRRLRRHGYGVDTRAPYYSIDARAWRDLRDTDQAVREVTFLDRIFSAHAQRPR